MWVRILLCVLKIKSNIFIIFDTLCYKKCIYRLEHLCFKEEEKIILYMRLLSILILLLAPLLSFSTTCTTVSDGDWTDNNTWSCDPNNGADTIIVNHSIIITSPNLTIQTAKGNRCR